MPWSDRLGATDRRGARRSVARTSRPRSARCCGDRVCTNLPPARPGPGAVPFAASIQGDPAPLPLPLPVPVPVPVPVPDPDPGPALAGQPFPKRKRREEEVHVASAVSARSRQGIAVLGFFVRSDLPPSRRCRSWGRPRSCRVTGPRTTPGRCRAPRAGRSRSPACPRRGRDSSSTLSRWSAIGGRVTAPEFLRGEEVQERPWRNHQRPSCWRGATMPATRDHVVEECPGRVPHAAQPFVQDVVRVEETSDSCDRGPQTAESCTRRSRPASRRPESLAVPRFVKNRRFDPGSVPVFPPPRPLIPPP